MKTMSNLRQALTYQINGLQGAEKTLNRALKKCAKKITSDALKAQLDIYLGRVGKNIIKLERALDYLDEKSGDKVNEVMVMLLKEANRMLKLATSDRMRDAMFIACMQSIIHYKIAGYGTAHEFARELRSHDVESILMEVLEWEKSTDRALTRIAMEEVNESLRFAGQL